jgi:hypothetical protein
MLALTLVHLDDNALFPIFDLTELRYWEEAPAEREARRAGLGYVSLTRNWLHGQRGRAGDGDDGYYQTLWR